MSDDWANKIQHIQINLHVCILCHFDQYWRALGSLEGAEWTNSQMITWVCVSALCDITKVLRLSAHIFWQQRKLCLAECHMALPICQESKSMHSEWNQKCILDEKYWQVRTYMQWLHGLNLPFLPGGSPEWQAKRVEWPHWRTWKCKLSGTNMLLQLQALTDGQSGSVPTLGIQQRQEEMTKTKALVSRRNAPHIDNSYLL